MNPRMRILHTSDWHIGNRLMEQSRLGEHAAFLDWLLATLREQQVEALLICGDVFDSTTPGDSARELYCDFLSRVDATGCRTTIITAGNHDSVQQLKVTAPLLARHHARVQPRLRPEDAADCLIPLHDAAGREAALVAAVPFLRVADVARRVAADEAEARQLAYTNGMADTYAAVAEAAKAWRAADAARAELPLIAMGHLTVSGASVSDSTRPVIIGSVEAVSSGMFDPVFDYVALGHLHKPAVLAGGRIRYCGSPLPMGFDEAALPHELLLVDIAPGRCCITPIPVPRFALYEEASCSSQAEVEALLTRLKEEAEAPCRAQEGAAPLPVWLKLTYSGGDQSLRELHTALAERAEACHLRGFRCMRAEGLLPSTNSSLSDELPSLREMKPHQLFARRLAEWGEGLDTPPSAETTALLSALFAEVAAEAQAETQPEPRS